MADHHGLIAVDWGSSRLRAWRFDSQGRLCDRYAGDQGVLKVGRGGFAGVLRTAVGAWLGAGSELLVSGMAGSRQGWVEAPYVPAPCGAAELAAALTAVPFDRPCRIVPGVVLDDADAPDVMRGEETQIVGLDDRSGAGRLIVLPGTHSKWVWCEAGRIRWFRTFMTGEVFDLLVRHSLLGRSMAGDSVDAAGFALGLAQAQRPGGLLDQLFGVRSRGLLGTLAATRQRGFLSGLLIGSEVAGALAAVRRAGFGAGVAEVTLVADASLAGWYAQALEHAGLHPLTADADAAAHGLWRLAREAAGPGRAH